MLVPKLRFKEFTNNYAKTTFGELAEYKKGPFGSALKKEIFIPKSSSAVKIYEQQNAIKKDWTLERYFIDKEYANRLKSFFVRPLDIIVSCAGTIGEIYTLPVNAEEGIINQALMRVRVNKEINQNYFIYLFDKMIADFSTKYSNGSAIKNIPPFADLKKQIVTIPNKEEQKKITNFLLLLDKKIELQTKKIEVLKLYKKGLNQRIFGKIENVKSIREIVKYENGTGYEKYVDENGKYKLISLNSINIDGDLVNNMKRIDFKHPKTLYRNDIVMVLSDVGHGDFLGISALIPNDNEYVLNQRIGLLRIIDNTIPEYLISAINYNQKKFKKLGQGSSQLNLSKDDVLNLNLEYPNKEVQLTIAKINTYVTEKIKLENKNLGNLQQLKKGLMQSMFV